MKRALMFAGVLVFATQISWAQSTISFSDKLENVDGDTSSWSTGDTTVGVGSNTWSLLGGQAEVKSVGGDITSRLTRGIGVAGGSEGDEIDNAERLVVKFDQPAYINFVEVRSLFAGEGHAGASETGRMRMYGANGIIHMVLLNLVGDADGKVNINFDNPFTVNKIAFFIPNKFKGYSDFAVSKLGVTMTPEPLSALLFVAGLGTLFVAGRKFRPRA